MYANVYLVQSPPLSHSSSPRPIVIATAQFVGPCSNKEHSFNFLIAICIIQHFNIRTHVRLFCGTRARKRTESTAQHTFIWSFMVACRTTLVYHNAMPQRPAVLYFETCIACRKCRPHLMLEDLARAGNNFYKLLSLDTTAAGSFYFPYESVFVAGNTGLATPRPK